MTDESPVQPGDGASPPAEPDTQPLTRVQRREAERVAAVHPAPAPPFRPVPAVVGVAVALAVLLAATIAVGPGLGAAAVALAGVVVAWGWPALTDAPDPWRTTVVIGLGSVGIGASVALTRDEPFLVWLPVALAVGVLVAFLQQVTRGGGRPHLVLGVAATASALAVTASGAMTVVLPNYPHGTSYVVCAAAATAVAALAELVALSAAVARWVLLPVVVLGVAAAMVAAAVLGDVPLGVAALLGALVAGVSHALRRVLLLLPGASATPSTPAFAAVASASVLLPGVVTYVLARVFAG